MNGRFKYNRPFFLSEDRFRKEPAAKFLLKPQIKNTCSVSSL